MLMKLQNGKLILLRQLDKRLSQFHELLKLPIPTKGWIYQIRSTINMSQAQMGKRLKISAQGISDLEKREAEASITLKSLSEAGEALNMKLVYGFVPKGGSLEELIEKRAHEIALKIVKRTSVTMSLEDQANSEDRLKQSIKEMTQDIKKEMPKNLWD